MPQPKLIFIGHTASGKSSAAEAAAERLGCELTDTDEIARRGEEVCAVFEREGEEGWRERERDACAAALASDGVVAIGAGAIEDETIRAELQRRSDRVVWCQVPIEVAWERASGTDRPLARDRAEFELRWERREPLYEQSARIVFTHSLPASQQIEWLLQTR